MKCCQNEWLSMKKCAKNKCANLLIIKGKFNWVDMVVSQNRLIVTYLSMTPWIGYFWSGCAGEYKRGLAIMGIGDIDIDNHECMTARLLFFLLCKHTRSQI